MVVVVAFSLLARISGEGPTIHSPPALFLFYSGDQLTPTNSTFLRQDQTEVAQQGETTVAKRSLISCV